jgi:hypothetical protein
MFCNDPPFFWITLPCKQCARNINVIIDFLIKIGGRHERMVGGITTTSPSVPITTKVVSSIPAHDDVYLMHYVIKFVNDYRQISGFFKKMYHLFRCFVMIRHFSGLRFLVNNVHAS